MDQNKNIDGTKTYSVAKLDDALKNDLRKSHFIFGNDAPKYQTISQQEFNDKSGLKYNGRADAHEIERSLRSHNYILGTDKPNYKSETQDKYIAPNMDNCRQAQKVSTHELQKSHYVFGTNPDVWNTTSQAAFYPKVSCYV
jgi:hypothetical protein